MAERLNDNVGKRIVEALKMQNTQDLEEESIVEEEPVIVEEPVKEEIPQESVEDINPTPEVQVPFNQPSLNIQPQISVDAAFQQSLNQNLNPSFNSGMQIQPDLDIPANVAVLNSLIAKLPAGVSKQTGALIIRQTMEALGIPMSSVIQEAQQVQEALSSKARECQRTILDYRKQINILELQAQQYQRQVVSMNDIIGLFVSKTL